MAVQVQGQRTTASAFSMSKPLQAPLSVSSQLHVPQLTLEFERAQAGMGVYRITQPNVRLVCLLPTNVGEKYRHYEVKTVPDPKEVAQSMWTSHFIYRLEGINSPKNALVEFNLREGRVVAYNKEAVLSACRAIRILQLL